MTRYPEHEMARHSASGMAAPQGDERGMTPMSPSQAMAMQPSGPNNIGMAMQMHAWAQVQSAYYMAKGAPRMVAACRQKMLDECKEFRFACDAVWAKPVGKEIKKGLGIRFAEAAAQCWTNLKIESTNICETDEMRILRTSVTDLESNVSFTRDTAVEKFVLRKKPPKLPDGQVAKVFSYNNYGEAQYRVRATADDMLMMQNAQLSKAERQLILKHIPKHIQDECKIALHQTLQAKASRGDRKMVLHILDQFAEIKISARQLETYLGHDPEVLTGIEITMLQGLFYDLADNRTTFADALSERLDERSEPPQELPSAPVGRARRAPRDDDEAPKPPPSRAPRLDRDAPRDEHPPHHDDRDWRTQQNTGGGQRQAPVQADEVDDDPGLSVLEGLDNLVDENNRPLSDTRHAPRERQAQESPERRERSWADDEVVSRTQRVLRALPGRPARGGR